MRRIVVTGARSPLARVLMESMRAHPNVESVQGIETRSRPGDETGVDFEIIPFVPDHRPIAEYLEKEEVDTVVQCSLVPDRSGTGEVSVEADVIATMCLGAAIGHEGSKVRSWVLASSTAVYPIGSQSPLLQREDRHLPLEAETLSTSIAEAEDYARDVAYRLPHVNVAILRLQQLVGEGVRGPLAALLGRDPIPTPIGFDPAIQFLRLEDAASAMAFALQTELAGIYNVASAGMIHLQEAIDRIGRTKFPVLPMSPGPLESLFGRLRIPFVPRELLDLVRFGHGVDTRKLERAGWRPRYDQADCLESLRDRRQDRRSSRR